MNNHDPNCERKFTCPVCNSAFDKNWRLKLHMKVHDNDDKGSSAKQDLLEPSRQTGLEAEPEQAQYSEAYVAGSFSAEIERELKPTLQKSTECSSHQQDELDPESDRQQFSRKRKANPLKKCAICGKQVKLSDMEGHQNQHDGKYRLP